MQDRRQVKNGRRAALTASTEEEEEEEEEETESLIVPHQRQHRRSRSTKERSTNLPSLSSSFLFLLRTLWLSLHCCCPCRQWQRGGKDRRRRVLWSTNPLPGRIKLASTQFAFKAETDAFHGVSRMGGRVIWQGRSQSGTTTLLCECKSNNQGLPLSLHTFRTPMTLLM